jgi:hypothetical protein
MRENMIFSDVLSLIEPRKIQNNVVEHSLGKCSYLMLSLSEETNGCVAT